jgi:hypothetical protein
MCCTHLGSSRGLISCFIRKSVAENWKPNFDHHVALRTQPSVRPSLAPTLRPGLNQIGTARQCGACSNLEPVAARARRRSCIGPQRALHRAAPLAYEGGADSGPLAICARGWSVQQFERVGCHSAVLNIERFHARRRREGKEGTCARRFAARCVLPRCQPAVWF